MTDDLDAIAELERLDAAATPAPWHVEENDSLLEVIGPRKGCMRNGVTPAWVLCVVDNGPFWDDAKVEAEDRATTALIILMRNHLPVLLAERRRMKAEIERLRTAGREYRCVNGHDLCHDGTSAGPECPYCERIEL